MRKLLDLNAKDAKKHLLKNSSYFNGDLPSYISFEPILKEVSEALDGKCFLAHKKKKVDLSLCSNVNYSFVANKDGRFAWRPYELMHPAIYVSLVNLLCSDENWSCIIERFKEFKKGAVTCCSYPMVSVDNQKAQAVQVRNWWQAVEQQSLKYSLEFSHVLHTDVTDCYGSLYTHSIAWALHGREQAKKAKGNKELLGNKIDKYIRDGRCGQTNGISQGSVLMDFIAELVLGYVDKEITSKLEKIIETDYRILRYRDDYRIFTNNDVHAEQILKVVSDALRTVGMKLGVSKTIMNTNVVEGSIKPDKLAGIDLQDLGKSNAKTLQKQLLRLHLFGRRYPNSGALRRLLGELHKEVSEQKKKPKDLEVQVAIATDIAVTSPLTFPAVAGILSYMISLEKNRKTKKEFWEKVRCKMSKVPYNGYLEVWLQRVTKPKVIGIDYESNENLCKIVNGESAYLWNNKWISTEKLINAVDVSKIIVKNPSETKEAMGTDEVELFNDNALLY